MHVCAAIGYIYYILYIPRNIVITTLFYQGHTWSPRLIDLSELSLYWEQAPETNLELVYILATCGMFVLYYYTRSLHLNVCMRGFSTYRYMHFHREFLTVGQSIFSKLLIVLILQPGMNACNSNRFSSMLTDPWLAQTTGWWLWDLLRLFRRLESIWQCPI